jgi:hypothetical protein
MTRALLPREESHGVVRLPLVTVLDSAPVALHGRVAVVAPERMLVDWQEKMPGHLRPLEESRCVVASIWQETAPAMVSVAWPEESALD